MKFIIKNLIFIFIITLISSFQIKAQIVQVYSLSKYIFEISNPTEFTLTVTLFSPYSQRIEAFILPAKGSKSFSKNKFDANYSIKLMYDKGDYLKARKQILNEAFPYYITNEIRGYLYEAFKKTSNTKISKSRKKTTDTILSYLGTSIVNSIVKEELSKLIYEQFIRFLANEKLYIASTYKRSDFYKEELAPKNLFNLIERGKSSKQNINPIFIPSVTVPLFKSSPNSLYKNRGGIFSVGLGGSLMMSPEWRWGRNSEIYSRLYLIGDFDYHIHDFKDDDSLFVGSSYVKSNLAREFHPLLTKEEVYTVFSYTGVGSVVRTLFGHGFFLEIGAGYRLRTIGTLRFDKGFSDGESYLGNGNELINKKYKGVIDEERSPYLILNLGYGQGKYVERGSPFKGAHFILRVRAYRSNLKYSENHHIYTKNSSIGDFENLSLSKKDNSILFWINFGLGYAF